MVPLLMRILVLAIVAFVAMQATALFLYLFFGVPFARGFAAGAVLGIAAAGLCAWLLWLLESEDGRAQTNGHHS
jgi:hypothetical protein